MPPPSQKVLSWLYNVLTSGYDNVDRTYTDIVRTISANPWISLRTDIYTDDDGRSSLLLNLFGPLSISFRGSSYAIPISIWIPHNHPYRAPMSFVTPATGMVIRPGQYTRGDGRIYHPYLANWIDDKSTVLELMSVLQDIYSREPPVVAHQGHVTKPTATAQQQAVPPPIPPLPAELGRSTNGGSRAAIAQDRPAPPPPPPPKAIDAHRQNSQHIHPATALPGQAANDSFRRKMSEREGRVRLSQGSQHTAYASTYWPEERYTPSISSLNPSLSRMPDGVPQNPSIPLTKAPYTPTPGASPNRSYTQDDSRPGQQHYPASRPSVYHHSSQSHGTTRDHQRTILSTAEATRAQPPTDLLTSPFEATLPMQVVNTAPPPVPSNPQKSAILTALSEALTDLTRSNHASNTSAIAPLRAQQAALSSTLKRLENEISQLDQLDSSLSDNESILRRAMQDADKVLQDAKEREIPSVDEVLFAPTVVARQLYDLVADERAIEDCRNILSKALDRGRVGASVWAKQTRSLAREEFLKKALIKKISTGMGLTDDQRWS